MQYSDWRESSAAPAMVRKAMTAVNQLWTLKPSPRPNQEKCLILCTRHCKVNKMTECLGGK